uniref:Uncharacterized protein n=1 Tax=Cajanus cajan TaxID=3821 RepID=A0A151TKL7_CAJCA|nr:hypothetical protein KK1_023933 [Cajanus cajan]
MRPLLLRMPFSWFRAGCRMLKSTHAMAGIMGSSSASPRLSSPSAMAAICWAAKAPSQLPRAEKTAPAIAVEVDSFGSGRVVGFDGMSLGLGLGLGSLVLRHFALIVAMADIVAAIDDGERGFQ